MMLGFVVSMSISTVEASNLPEWVLDTDLLYNSLYYRPVDGGVMIVYATGSATNVVPAQINGQDVVAIGANAFSDASYNSSVKARLEIQGQVSYIGENAF